MVAKQLEIGDLILESGVSLRNVSIAYETIGTLAPNRDNVILALHGYSGGPDMILPTQSIQEGSWQNIIGPGCTIDTNRYFVICPNTIGSTYGSTGPASINPQTGRPYGAAFPSVTVRDVVASQHALLKQLGIEHVVAVIGASYGGMQALQWGVSYPDFMDGVVAVITPLASPPSAPAIDRIRGVLAKDPRWNNGDYYDGGNLVETLTAMRTEMLRNFGLETVLSQTIADPEERARILAQGAREWAQNFDANALWIGMAIMGTHDVTADLDRMRAPVLYVLSRTDSLFPPSIAPEAMRRFRDAGVAAEYFEIDSRHGHSAAAVDAHLWMPTLQRFLASLKPRHTLPEAMLHGS